MRRLEVSGAVRPMYGSLGVKRLMTLLTLSLQNAQKARIHFGIMICGKSSSVKAILVNMISFQSFFFFP